MYTNLVNEHSAHDDCIAWKLRFPMKIKIFLWYLKKGVILTKDNLLKRKWKGDGKCCFCNNEENIQHLFFECHLAKFVWRAVYFTFGINPPDSIGHLLGSWLNGYPAKLKKLVLVGASAMCCAIWLCQNDIVFHQSNSNSYLQVIFGGAYWARFWSLLSEEEARTDLRENCQRLEAMVMALFARNGWNFRRRIAV